MNIYYLVMDGGYKVVGKYDDLTQATTIARSLGGYVVSFKRKTQVIDNK